jgi:hypothetical protein
VELVARFAFAHDHRARRELVRREFGREEFDNRQRQRREHGQLPEQLRFFAGCGHRPVEPGKAASVDQRQDRQGAA